MMKKITVICCIVFGLHQVYGQTESAVIQKLDSIFQKVSVEKDPQLRTRLMLKIFSTKIEQYPHLVLYGHEKLYKIALKNKDKAIEAISWSIAGHGYRLSGNYIKGLEYHQKAVAMAEKSGDSIAISLTQTLMAHLYKDREDYPKALKLYLAAYKIKPKGDNEKTLIFWIEGNLAMVYLATNKLDSCIYYGRKRLETKDAKNFDFQSLNSIAGAYSKMGKSRDAEKLYHQCINAMKTTSTNRMLHIAYLAFAEHFQRLNRLDSAAYYATKSVQVISNTGYGYLAMKPAKLLTDIYQESNTDSTMKYLKIFRSANDSLYSTQTNQQLQMMTFEDDMRQRKLESEKVEYENKTRMNLMLGGLGAFFLIGIILYYNNRQKQKANKILKNTLANLKSTQSQLIQSEKMASLGELTAGIAHEIQNPLNFVNNFSDVSMEMIEEIEVERQTKNDKRDEKLIDEILTDIKQNLVKINHHGKRADAIVKGMLQHSRTNSGKKELTDINALADEYLRLAYHGLRAKDKSFNATLETDFDGSIGKVAVVAQDIGRVILNLITNAFHAVDEKKKSGIENYNPTVAVSTKKDGNSILISVKDNGNGIPDAIKDKIFQPFFTTKPTGQGTGLGLSLAYDIVKAHGGELSVATKENDGSVFTIKLAL